MIENMQRYLVENVDTANHWSSYVGHGSTGLSLAMIATMADYRNSMFEEDEQQLDMMLNKFWLQVEKGCWGPDDSVEFTVDGCKFFISAIKDTKH